MSQSLIISYWCLPCDEDAARYSAVMTALAKAQRAPIFAAHLTLASLDRAVGMADVASALSGLVLDPVAIDGTEEFTKSLFVRFGASATLLAARDLIRQMPGHRPGRSFDPHISLCYGPPPAGSRQRREVQDLLTSPVRFDRLAAVRVAVPVSSHADVAA